MARVVRWGAVALALIVLSIGGYYALRWRTTQPPSPYRLDPTRPIIEVEIPLVSVAKDRGDTFVLPDEIAVPPRAIVRIKGKFRAGSRKGGALVVAEAKVPSTGGRMALFSNGANGVRMSQGSECDFELLMHFPKNVRPGVLEVRLGDEFLAIGKFKAAP